jgi:molecular chaperone DnaK
VQTALDAAKKAVQGDDHAAITAASADLQKASHQMAEVLYKATQGSGGGEPGAPGTDAGAAPPDGDVVDAEFSETK